MDDRIEASKIFIWGQVGDKLKRLDAERLMSIAQDNPDYFLSIRANIEIDTLIDLILSSKDLTPSVKSMILKINHLDNLFREVSIFMKDSNDMLSIGSFMTGEIEKQKALLYLGSKNKSEVI